MGFVTLASAFDSGALPVLKGLCLGGIPASAAIKMRHWQNRELPGHIMTSDARVFRVACDVWMILNQWTLCVQCCGIFGRSGSCAVLLLKYFPKFGKKLCVPQTTLAPCGYTRAYGLYCLHTVDCRLRDSVVCAPPGPARAAPPLL